MEKLDHRNPLSGFLLIDKPEGPTSHDVVNQARRILGIRKIGHAGALDPFATGLLILCVGPAARFSEYLIKKDKMYVFTLVLGAATDSYDKTGNYIEDKSERVAEKPVPHKKAIESFIREFTGEITQTPPVYSAIKIRGRRLYDYARKGDIVEVKPRKVTIKSLSIMDYQYPRVTLMAKVSSGTYIRSLGNDIGVRLGTRAYVESLRRTEIGGLNVKDAVSSVDCDEGKERLLSRIISVKDMFPEWVRIPVPADKMERVMNGNPVSCEGVYSGAKIEDRPVLLLDGEGNVFCEAYLMKKGGIWRIFPKRILK